MAHITAEPLFEVRCQLGESPLWHPVENRLYWVDILNQNLCRSDTTLTQTERFHFQTTLGAFGFRESGGFVLATGKGFAFWDIDDPEPEFGWNPLPDRAGVRMNDGKVDPAGRFWAGSIDTEQSEAGLYRLDPDGTQHTFLRTVGISNGLGWSPDRKTMYYTDSARASIFAFDYDLETGRIRHQRTFVHLRHDNREIVPDGLCVDAEGFIWSAQWNGRLIIRYDPQGTPVLKVMIPVQRPTSCCFGGEKNDQLFITSARADFNIRELQDQPNAGDVFVVQTDTQGQETNFFGSLPH